MEGDLIELLRTFNVSTKAERALVSEADTQRKYTEKTTDEATAHYSCQISVLVGVENAAASHYRCPRVDANNRDSESTVF